MSPGAADPGAAREAARRHLEMVATRITSADEDFWQSEEGRSAGALAIPPAPSEGPPARRRSPK